MDAAPECGAGLPDFFKKYVNPRLAKFEDVSAATGHITIAAEIPPGANEAKELIEILTQGSTGTDTSANTSSSFGDTLLSLPQYSHIETELWGIKAMLVRTPELGTTTMAFDLITSLETLPDLISRLSTAGAKTADENEWERRRIQIGWPKWGVDMDDNTFPQEANMIELNAISFTKGCYIGQETVARIHYRGHVNKFLRLVEIQSPDSTHISLPAPVFSAEGKEVGTITSIAGDTGIAMIRREIEDGAELTSGASQQSEKPLSDLEGSTGSNPLPSAVPYKIRVKKTAQGLA